MAKYGRLNVIDPVICYRSYLGEGS
jgi:hypothetical protein